MEGGAVLALDRRAFHHLVIDLLADRRRAGQAVRVRVVVVLVVAVVVVALRDHAADLSLVDYVVRESCKISSN